MALTTNLVAAWDLSDTSDSSGNGRTLTNTGVTFTTGLIGNCGVWNPRGVTGDNMKVNSNLGITGGACTISLWYKATTDPTGGAFGGDGLAWVGCGTPNFVGNCIMYEKVGSPRLNFWRNRSGIANDNYTYTTTLTTGTWYHLVYVYDGSTVQGYLNSSAVGAGVASTGNGSSGISDWSLVGSITNGASGANWTPDGSIDMCYVWSRALSGSEITQLYNSGAGLAYPFASAATSDTNFFGGGL